MRLEEAGKAIAGSFRTPVEAGRKIGIEL